MVLKFSTQKPQQYTPTPSANTKLLLHGQNLLDYSGNGHSATASGDASVGNSGNPFGFGGTFSFGGDGTGQIAISDSAVFDLSNNDFVIDFNYQPDGTAYQMMLGQYGLGDNVNNGWGIDYNTSGNIEFQYSKTGTDFYSVAIGITLDTSNNQHIAVVRSGSTIYAYQKGVLIGSSTSIGSDIIYNSSRDLIIGRNPNEFLGTFWPATGKISEIRIINGSDNGWTGSTIDVPTAPYKYM